MMTISAMVDAVFEEEEKTKVSESSPAESQRRVDVAGVHISAAGCNSRQTSRICIPKHFMHHLLPCKYKDINGGEPAKSTAHIQSFPNLRHLLAAPPEGAAYCDAKGKAPLLSLKALHDLHIFIFALAVSHVAFSALTIFLAGLKIKHWEESIQKREYYTQEAMKTRVTHVQDHAVIKGRFSGIFKLVCFSWMAILFGQKIRLRRRATSIHYESLWGKTKVQFLQVPDPFFGERFQESRGNKLVFWVFVVALLLLNVYGWHTYFRISFVPLVLLFAVGTKLEQIITQLATETTQKYTAVAGDLVVSPSDDHFWFRSPRLILNLIHFILFQNAFQIAVFFWMLVTFGFESCIMGEIGYIIPRLVIGMFVQLFCSYSTLPLYNIVAHLRSQFYMTLIDHIQATLLGWAQRAKNKAANKGCYAKRATIHHGYNPTVEITEIQVQQLHT